jgi:serine/threonine-protein kinase HipA
MAFSAIVHNTDDHLRNHGFLLTPKGWRLSPMFDVNPNPHGGESALDMGDIFEDSELYRISRQEAKSIYDEMLKLVSRARG